MNYDFTTVIDRTGKDSVAVEKLPIPDVTVSKNYFRIPMWIADMNFATAPSVQKHLLDRTAHPLFGYFNPSTEFYQSIINWQKDSHHIMGLTPDCIGYENGVLGGITTAAQAFCSPGDYILLHSPTYVGFTNTLTNNGFQIALSPLYLDNANIWRMDFDDMEKKIQTYNIHLAILCSPHNPTGRVWTLDELNRFMAICQKHNCIVLSDEIWSDLTLNTTVHIPVQSISEDARQRTIAFYSPSKSFNLAGLTASYHIIYNQYLRNRMHKQASLCHYNTMNVLSMHALIGAYSKEGRQWLYELNQTLNSSIDFACSYIQERLNGISISKPQSTYMLFLNCRQWCLEHNISMDSLLKSGIESGVIWQDGRPFHDPYGIRINLAVPPVLLHEAFRRLEQNVFTK